jgi:hypothetical protein
MIVELGLKLTYSKVHQGANKYFESLDDMVLPGNPVDDWLNSAPIPLSVDSITYWTGMDATGDPLARMALDFLSIPGMQ